MENSRYSKTGLFFSRLQSLMWLSLLAVMVPGSGAFAAAKDVEKLLDMTLEDLIQIPIQVGSRTGQQRFGDFAQHVDVLTAGDLRRTGYGELPKALNVLLPSFTYAFATIDDLTDHVRPFSLDGLKGDQVLVLINGKRIHRSSVLDLNDSQMRGSASVDLNLIPIEAISRIEVLHDDASAQYGSDALAGVINVVLKNADANEMVTLLGRRAAGDGEMRSLSYNRGDGKHFLSLEIKAKNASNTSGLDRRDYYFPGDPRNGDYRVTHRYGDPEHRSLSLTFNGDTGGGEGFYYLGKLTVRHSEAAGFFRRSLDDRNVRSIYPNGYLPLLTPDQKDIFVSAGYRAKWGRFDVDVSNTFGYNRMNIEVSRTLNASLGGNSPTEFNAGTLQYWQNGVNVDVNTTVDIGAGEAAQFAFGGEARYENFSTRAGEFGSWADGLVPVLDGPNAGADTASGAQLYPGFTPGNAGSVNRKLAALYAEIDQRFSDRLRLKLAARGENYSDFGNTLNGKLLVNYRPAEAWVLRGSLGTGFKAPSLQQIGTFRTATSVSAAGVFAENGTFPVSHPLSRLLGAKDLKPEESTRINLGVTYRPTERLRFGLDSYVIKVKDRIALSGDIRNSAELSLPAQNLMTAQGVTFARYLTNAVDTTTKGAAISFNYDTSLAGGQLGLQAQYQHNRTTINEIHVPAALANIASVVFDRQEQERLTTYLPRNKALVSTNYRSGPFEWAIRATYFGRVKYVASSSDPTTDQWFSGKTLLDFDVSYRLNSLLTVALGAHNVLNVRPDYRLSSPPFNGQDNILQFRGISPFDYNGAWYYVRAVFEF